MNNTCPYCKLQTPRGGACKDCMKTRNREYQRKKYFQYYLWLKEQGCSYCETNSPSCLEVHHLSKNSKRFNTSSRGQSEMYNKEDVEKEIAIVLCANCHSTFHRHWGGKGAYFPEQTKESTMKIIEMEYDKWNIIH